VKIYFASTGIPDDKSCIPALRRLAEADRHGVHSVSLDPEDADIILFTECHLIPDWRLRVILDSPLVRRFHEKCYVYDERDRPWCALPGVFVSMPKQDFREAFQRSWGYCGIEEPFVRLGLARPPGDDPDLLVSFAGTRSHRSRSPLYGLRHERAVIEETIGFVFFDPKSVGFAERRARFAELLYRSKFVLCPRGRGTSSIRLYETMAAGRAPVIVADDWVPPVGPEWDAFAVRWPERGADRLIAHLETIEGDAERMGAAAYGAYLEFFAADTVFHRLIETLGQVRNREFTQSFPSNGLRDGAYWKTGLSVARDSARVRLGALRRSLGRAGR